MSQDMSSSGTVTLANSLSIDKLGGMSNQPFSTPLLRHVPQPQPQYPKRQRYSSRSNSVSGSSVTTVQRAASRSSSRNGVLHTRSQSPNDNLHALKSGHSRRRSVAVDPSIDRSSSSNVDNSNRWSQSTDSSLTSSKRHKRASSGALLNTQPLSPQRRPPQVPEEPHSRQAGHRQQPVSPIESFERPWLSANRPNSRGNPLPTLRNGLEHDDAELDTLSTASTSTTVNSGTVTPSTHSSYATDYFNQNTSPRNPARPQTARNTTAPSMSLNYSRMPRAEDVKESAHYRRQSEHMNSFEAKMTKITNDITEEKKSHAKNKDRTEREKKAMLSKALAKANTAVVLDNQQNFVDALAAYNDACSLLQQVMDRSVNAADRRKLDAIKITYTTRIEELQILEEARSMMISKEKGLPERPQSNESMPPAKSQLPRLLYPEATDRDSFFTRTMADVEKAGRLQDETILGTTKPNTDGRLHIANQRVSKLPAPEESRYLPAPLIMKKTPSPTRTEFPQDARQHLVDHYETFHTPVEASYPRGITDASDRRSSRSSSVHSISSQTGVRRKAIHDDVSNAELDAAFDAAVEAAYDEGLEPDFESKPTLPLLSHTQTKSANVSVQDIQEISTPLDTRLISPTEAEDDEDNNNNNNNNDNNDEEEERILDEFTQDYGHGFNFAFGSKSALPRESDSSGYSRSTWQSSQTSERMTAGTSLSTVAENESAHRLASNKPPVPDFTPISPLDLITSTPSGPPPTTSLPPPPPPPLPPSSSLPAPISTVRHRRLSGQNARELKIETSVESQNRRRASTLHSKPSHGFEADERTDTHKEVIIGAPLEASPSDAAHERMLKSPPSLDILSTFASSERVNTPYTPLDTPRSDDMFNNLLGARPTLIRKNQSSLSLRADHTVLLPSPGLHEMGDATPLSATFAMKSKFGQDSLTAQRVAFSSFASNAAAAGSSASGGKYLFDTSLSTGGRLPTSPLQSPLELPPGLEPCPESFLMRPFWLMRCLASTITHPRGGFVTTRLFVPREVWQTRGVKLKSIDDKIANCDLLTAALGQLSQVDTFDADAVMEELQRFEEVMERVQSVLVKKLGHEVGVHGVAAIFRDAPPATSSSSSVVNGDKSSDTMSGTTDKSSKSHSSKGYLSSWRKLRSKSSGAPSGHGAIGTFGGRGGDKELHAMSSVPMTSFVPVERRGQKRDVRNLSFDGPNKEYMSSLARLFQGVQVLDQITRQVEDPGLKHSSPTHVGLELSIRHAAEFFSFYICRFVLADLGILVDKYVKRGTEWVMS